LDGSVQINKAGVDLNADGREEIGVWRSASVVNTIQGIHRSIVKMLVVAIKSLSNAVQGAQRLSSL